MTIEMLDEMIANARKEIDTMPAGSQERSRAIKDLKNLVDTKLSVQRDEEAKIEKEHEYYVASKKEEANKTLEIEKRKNENKDRIWNRVKDGIQIGVTVLTGVATAAFTWYGLKMEYNNGNATSFTLKNCLKDLTHRK